MGSIVAVLSYARPATAEDVERGLRASPHRGSKIATAALSRFVVGASTSPGWEDATVASGEGLVAAVQGRIDNLAELIGELPPGSDPSNMTAADAMLELFRRHADRTPELLRGVFAAVVSDGTRVWCFRDHLGFATLFYRAGRDAVHVATEAKQVVAATGIPWRPDPDVAEAIFHRDYDDETPAALKGVDRLPKMTILAAEPGRLRRRRYWHPERLLETASYSRAELQERFDELMTRAVARALTGDGDVLSLSGGVDSPALAAYAAPEHLRRTGRPLAAITTSYPHLPAVDELEYVEEVVRQLGMSLHVVHRNAAVMEGVDDLVRLLDGPVPKIAIGDAIEGYSQVRDLGFRTMFTGEVAEYLTDQRSGLIPHLVARGKLGAAWTQIRGTRAKGLSSVRLAKQVALAFVPLPVERSYRRLHPRDDPTIPEWLDTPPLEQLDTYEPSRAPARRRWNAYQLNGFVGPGLSMEADTIVHEMCGIRVRRPWADVDLWEFFLSLPAETKFPDARRKALARELLRGRVPDVILDRKGKVVFDDSIMERIDYPALRRWLVDPPVRVRGVDYELLEKRLADEDFGVWDHIWAKDLAAVHAFVGQG